MLHRIFSVRDNAAEAFLPPFCIPTVGMAVRSFSDAVADPKHQFAAHPEDYTLYELGDYDDASGLLTSLESPRPIMTGLECLQKQAVLQE